MPNQEQNEPVNLENLKIVLRFVDKDFSRYTLFVPLFKFSKSFLKLENKFSLILALNYHSKQYPVPKMANLITSLLCCGVDRFARMDDEFRIEHGLSKSLGFIKGFPTSDTIYRFLRSFNGWNINQLEKINLELLKEQKKNWLPQVGSLFVDLDMNTKSVEGKQIEKASLGYNRKHPGRLSLNWTVAHIARVALYSELNSGKTSGKKILQRQVEYIEKLLGKLEISENIQNRLIWRLDGGYFSYDNLKLMKARKFITRLPGNLTVLHSYLEDKTLRWSKYSQWCEYTNIGLVLFPDIDLRFRIVLVKIYRKKKILLYPLCTNLFNWTTKNIVKAYRGRQIVEDCFRDTNQAFYSNKLPSSSFYGNAAFLWFIVLAYNLFFFFQKASQSKKT